MKRTLQKSRYYLHIVYIFNFSNVNGKALLGISDNNKIVATITHITTFSNLLAINSPDEINNYNETIAMYALLD